MPAYDMLNVLQHCRPHSDGGMPQILPLEVQENSSIRNMLLGHPCAQLPAATHELAQHPLLLELICIELTSSKISKDGVMIIFPRDKFSYCYCTFGQAANAINNSEEASHFEQVITQTTSRYAITMYWHSCV
jgi:hypothetical protein